MVSASPLPRRFGHLRIFLVSLGVLVLGLAVFLFAVRMETTATAHGVVTARGQFEVRAPVAGVVEVGRWEKERFVKLESGDKVRGGETIVTIQGAMTINAPADAPLWLGAGVHISQGQAVEAGQRLLTLVPLDLQTHQPRELLGRLEVGEEHIIEVQAGQTVRVSSNLYNERIHGKFSAVVERIEPLGFLAEDGKRRFHVVVALEDPPGPLLLGSGLKAEIVLGRKQVYRIILEH